MPACASRVARVAAIRRCVGCGRVSVSIDTSVADAVLLAATSNAAHAQALTDAALALPGVDAMICKRASLHPRGDSHRFWRRAPGAAGPGRTFDGASETAARLAISHVRFMGREMGLMSLRLLENVKPLKLRIDKTDTDQIARATHDPPDSTLCQPIGTTISSTYGQVPRDDLAPMLQKANADIEHFYQ